jgi:hypothetical protein
VLQDFTRYETPTSARKQKRDCIRHRLIIPVLMYRCEKGSGIKGMKKK